MGIYNMSCRKKFLVMPKKPCDGNLATEPSTALRRKPCDEGLSAARALRWTLQRRPCDTLPRAKWQCYESRLRFEVCFKAFLRRRP